MSFSIDTDNRLAITSDNVDDIAEWLTTDPNSFEVKVGIYITPDIGTMRFCSLMCGPTMKMNTLIKAMTALSQKDGYVVTLLGGVHMKRPWEEWITDVSKIQHPILRKMEMDKEVIHGSVFHVPSPMFGEQQPQTHKIHPGELLKTRVQNYSEFILLTYSCI